MTIPGFGDLARTGPLTRHGVQARADLARLAQELTTGRHGDVARAERGDLRPLAGIERSLTLAARHEATALSVQGRMSVMQTALDAMQTTAHDAAGDLLMIAGPSSTAAMGQALPLSEAAFGTAVSALNARFGTHHVFSGAAGDRAPLPGDEALLDQLRADIGSAAITDPAALRAAVRSWFAPGGGLDAAFPLPGADQAAVVPIGDGDLLEIEPTVADPALRGTLAELATAVLAAEGAGLDRDGRRDALRAAGQALITDAPGLSDARGRLGASEARSERALTRARAEATALEFARADLVEVDRYETATRLQAVEAGVETLYLVTARLSDLSLTRYMR